ncbi:MAG: HAMP domain-containing histidine kinase [Lachnospiraceae bacterium]|nr:HAMP domain-containing histidine kinase [Lachnospiraceae bacterium]
MRLQITLFFKAILMLLLAALVSFILYQSMIREKFGDFVVNLLSGIYNDYDYAYLFYQYRFREYKSLYLIAGGILIFLIVLGLYSRMLAKYFAEINRGIDAIIAENSDDVQLSPELSAIEKKINYIKRVLAERKTEAQLAEQRKNDLVVYLAHDLKTPLTSVIGYLSLLHDEQQISEELRAKYLGITLEKAERLEDLINEFFEITRFNLSHISLEYSKVNLTRMLEQLTFEFKPMLMEKQLECSLECPPDLQIRCDIDKIERVFDNLLRNAVNYSDPDEPIRIAVTTQEQAVSIRFINKGDTIPPEKLERLFEQFYRLDNSRSSKSGGAGLGLAISKEIVELHGGTISVKSEHEETEFEVILPLL